MFISSLEEIKVVKKECALRHINIFRKMYSFLYVLSFVLFQFFSTAF